MVLHGSRSEVTDEEEDGLMEGCQGRMLCIEIQALGDWGTL